MSYLIYRICRKQFATIVALYVLLVSVVILLSVPDHAEAACASTSYGSITATASVPTAGTYRIWSRLKVPNSTNNSYLLEVDGGTCYVVGKSTGIPANTWTWVSYQNGNTNSNIDVSLSAGIHTLKAFGNTPNVQIDRIIISVDIGCIPSGFGDNCVWQASTEGASPSGGAAQSSGGDSNGGTGTTKTADQQASPTSSTSEGGILQNLSPKAVSANAQKLAKAAKQNPLIALILCLVFGAIVTGTIILARTDAGRRFITRYVRLGKPSPALTKPSSTAYTSNEPTVIHPENRPL